MASVVASHNSTSQQALGENAPAFRYVDGTQLFILTPTCSIVMAQNVIKRSL